jgi:flagellum-specific ATP synthase
VRTFEALAAEAGRIDPFRVTATVVSVVGTTVKVTGFGGLASVGDRVRVEGRSTAVSGEVVGFVDNAALLLLHGKSDGIAPGSRVILGRATVCRPTLRWLGRVINAFGEPVDGKGPLPVGDLAYPLRAQPPNPYARKLMGGRLETRVRIIDSFLPLCRGQRLGIFAGSGVGKSTLMSMLARFIEADVIVIGLIGERGKEIRDFLEHTLGEEGLRRSIVVTATSDETPLVRRQAAWQAMAVAEFFRDQNLQVLCMLDSVTRFAMAQREIGLAAGEPPTTKGYPPSTFAELPGLLERAGPGVEGTGDITAIFTVLVDGGDHDEPVADAVRGILDGHIVMDRRIGERGRYPAIDLLKSVSRALPRCHSPEENQLINLARGMVSSFEDVSEMVRLGAYKHGSDPRADAAIAANPALEAFMGQHVDERSDAARTWAALQAAVAVKARPARR